MTAKLSIEPFTYEDGRAPTGYVCGACGAHGLKLFRPRPEHADRTPLLCAECTMAESPLTTSPDQRGFSRHLSGVDTTTFGAGCGERWPAIPTSNGLYLIDWDIAPMDARQWWKSVPTFPSPPVEGAPYNVVMELAERDGAHASAVWGTYAWRWQARLALTWFRIFDAMPGCTFRLEGTKQRP